MGDGGRHGGMDGITMSRKRGVKGGCNLKTRGGNSVGGRRVTRRKKEEEEGEEEKRRNPTSVPSHLYTQRAGVEERGGEFKELKKQ